MYLFSCRIFVNRSLYLEKIKFFGFDMDYTLAGILTLLYTINKFLQVARVLTISALIRLRLTHLFFEGASQGPEVRRHPLSRCNFEGSLLSATRMVPGVGATELMILVPLSTINFIAIGHRYLASINVHLKSLPSSIRR